MKISGIGLGAGFTVLNLTSLGSFFESVSVRQNLFIF